MNQKGILTTTDGDLPADIHAIDWLDVGGGTKFKVLRLCEHTGQWALYVNMAPGARFQAHRHEGTGQFFVTKGKLIYDAGTAGPGTYGFEPVFAVHVDAHCEEETEMLFLGQGAVTYLDAHGNVDYVFNVKMLKEAMKGLQQLDISPA